MPDLAQGQSEPQLADLVSEAVSALLSASLLLQVHPMDTGA